MKNILFIHQSSELYGSDKTLLLFLTHIDRKLFNPTVILPYNGPLCSELEKIAKQKGSKKHKRFVYNTSTKEALLVESNSISNELEDEDVVYVTI